MISKEMNVFERNQAIMDLRRCHDHLSSSHQNYGNNIDSTFFESNPIATRIQSSLLPIVGADDRFFQGHCRQLLGDSSSSVARNLKSVRSGCFFDANCMPPLSYDNRLPPNTDIATECTTPETEKRNGATALSEEIASRMNQRKKRKSDQIVAGEDWEKKSKRNSKRNSSTSTDYIQVRARRGQATDSHSLAERARREKINMKMKCLQELVPGCSKATGKAGMLDEIINYVHSLQRQIEHLSMKLACLNPNLSFKFDKFLTKDIQICEIPAGHHHHHHHHMANIDNNTNNNSSSEFMFNLHQIQALRVRDHYSSYNI